MLTYADVGGANLLPTADRYCYIYVLILLYMLTYTAVCVSSYCYICVLILLYLYHKAGDGRFSLDVSSYCYICVLMLLYLYHKTGDRRFSLDVAAICVLMLLHVSSYCCRCTTRLATGGSRSGTTALVCGGWAILPTSVRRLEGRLLKGIIYRLHWYVAVGRYCRCRFDGWKGVR